MIAKSALELQSIARAGAGMEVDGNRYSCLELQSVARALSDGAILIVENSNRFSALELQSIGRAAKGKVILR